MVAATGMFWVSITTSTANAVLIVMSGKVLGFGVIELPAILITLAEGGPAVGRRSGKGVEISLVP
jgi:hypothetical protein